MTLVCQISDMHIKAPGALSRGNVDCAAMLAQCVQSILRLPQRPDFVVATGDLVEFGNADEYAHLRRLLEPLGMPVHFITGNHDDRATLRDAFPEHRYLREWTPFIQYAVEDWPLRIVALDTLVPGKGGGALCSERLAWLERTLAAEPAKPTLVIMHHPPFDTLIDALDRSSLSGREALAGIVGRHPQVEAILCGHIHRSIQHRFAGTRASVCPSTTYQVALDMAPGEPLSYIMEPPGYQLHAWHKSSGVVSHTASIGGERGPHPFR